MAKTGWRAWLDGKRRAARLELERLEDRLAPATNISVIAGAAGAGTLDHFLSAANGTITTADDPGDPAATLSVGALQGVGPGVNISITADNTITFSNIGALNLQTVAGADAAFTANTGAIAFPNASDAVAAAGGSLTFHAADLSAANLNSNGGDVTLTAGDTMTLAGMVNAGGGDLSLMGGTIAESGAGSVAGANLDAEGVSSVDLTRNPSDVTGGLSGQSGGFPFSFTNSVGFSVASGGIKTSPGNATTPVGPVTLTALTGTLTVAGPINASNITLNADDMAINAPVQSDTFGVFSASEATVTLRPVTPTRGINLGTNTPGDLGLTDAELAEITALVLRIGDTADSGDIRVTAAVSANPNDLERSLLTGGAIVESGGSIAGQDLVLAASHGIGDAAPLITQVGRVAFANLGSGAVQISNTGDLFILPLDTLTDSVNDGGATTLTTVGQMDFLAHTTSAGTLTATANESTPAAFAGDLFAADMESTGGDVVLRAGARIQIAGAAVKSDAGNVILDIGLDDNGGSDIVLISGTIEGTSPTVNGGGGAGAVNTLLLDFADGATLPDGLTFNGSAAGNDTMTVSDADGATVNNANADAASAHTYDIDGARVVRDAATTIAYTNLAGVTVNGGDASDTFDVTPSAATTFTVHGGLPTPQGPPPGDALTVETAGTANPTLTDTFDPTMGYSGSWTFGDRLPVHFDTIERLAPSADLSISATGPATAVAGDPNGLDYTLTVTNNGPSDNTGGFTVTDTLPAGETFQAAGSTPGATVNGQTVTYTNSTGLARGGPQTFTIHVTAAASVPPGTVLQDSATVTAAAGGPIDPNPTNNTSNTVSTVVGPLSGAVVVNGTSGDDMLIVTATGPDSGSYSLNGGPAVPFVGATSFTFNGDGGADTMIVNNPTGDLFRPSGGVFFNGALGSSLQILGGVGIRDVFAFGPNSADGGHNGSILLIGALGTANYTYTELSPVLVNAGTPQDVIFFLPDNGQDNEAVLQASGTPGQSEILSQDGGFETTTFADPAGSVVIDVQGSVRQTINAQALPGVAVLFVNGTGSTVLNFDAQGRPVGAATRALTFDGAPVARFAGVSGLDLLNAAGVDAAVGPDTADRGTAFLGLTAQERFVQALYLADLGRAGAGVELDGWVGFYNTQVNAALAGGATAGQAQFAAQQAVATGIVHSSEGRDYLVKSWYETFLDRSAQGVEEMGWVNLLLGGTSEEQTLSGILASAEFGARARALTGAAPSDQAYVQALYLLLLNRAAESGGLAAWLGALPTLGRQGVALGFLTDGAGPEFRTNQFQGYYNALLHRPAEDSVLMTWVFSNLNIDAARINFEASPEFFTNG